VTEAGGVLGGPRIHPAPLPARLRPSSFVPPGARPSEMRLHEPAGSFAPTALEALLRSLLAADGREDTERRVVDGVRDLLHAEWTTLSIAEAEGWSCRCTSGAEVMAVQPHPPPREAASDSTAGHNEASTPLRAEIEAGGARVLLVVGPPRGGGVHDGNDRALLAHVLPDLSRALQRAAELERLRSHALIDALTNCYNRRGFDEQLIAELRRAQRYERAAALMLVDLDGFKRINDELGHQAGDHVLRRFASLLSGTFRNTDIVSRYGGDEFAVVFPETTTAEAERLAERVRGLLGSSFPDEVVPRPVSASFGIASYPADAGDADGLIATADRALYAAKLGGRDRVVAARPRGSSSP
jgi:diguanylate cyclase (GGDEF)-like protein